MAKKRYEDTLPANDEVMENIEEVEAEAPTIEEASVEEPSDVERFINAQLVVINSMTDRAKARRASERVLRNRKR